MKFPNNSQLNLILIIVLELIVECYILSNMKIVLIIKLGLAITEILDVYGFNLLDYLSNENTLVMEYLERKLFGMRKDNAMLKTYLDKKDELQALRHNLILDLSKEFRYRKIYEDEIAKIARNIEQTKQEKNEEIKELKNN